MSDLYTIEYESPDGSTASTTQTLLPLEWREASITFRRRAPHTGSISIPGASHHLPSDFTAGRELRIKRNGAHWFAGIMDAPSVDGPRGRRRLTLPLWGQAKVLAFARGQISDTIRGTLQSGATTTQLVELMLGNAVHGTFGVDGAWFPAAGQSLSLKSTTPDFWVANGKSILEAINDLCDFDGLDWYVGINSSGVWTFTTSSSAPTLTGAALGVKLVDGANCDILSVAQDGSQITGSVTIAGRRPKISTKLFAGYAAGVTSIVVDDASGIAETDTLVIAEGAASEEAVTVSAVSGTTLTLTSATGSAHALGDTVTSDPTQDNFRATTRTTANTTDADHHAQSVCIYDDSAVTVEQRQGRGDVYLAAYDHALRTPTVRVTDRALLDLLAWQPLVGNSLALVSDDRLLSDWYGTPTSLVVQEYTLTLRDGVVVQMDLALGDPALDALAVLERRTAAGQAAATAATTV